MTTDELKELWTIVNQDGTPVVPVDENPESADEGMLVYFSRRAAELAAEYQSETFDGMDCRAERLGRLIPPETEEPDYA